MTNKNLAILGLVLSFLIPLAGLIISAVALNKFKQSGDTDGKGLATAGLIIGIIMMVIAVIGSACVICSAGALAGLAGSY